MYEKRGKRGLFFIKYTLALACGRRRRRSSSATSKTRTVVILANPDLKAHIAVLCHMAGNGPWTGTSKQKTTLRISQQKYTRRLHHVSKITNYDDGLLFVLKGT